MAKNKNKKKLPRETPTHENYFMSLAFWTATLSKDPHRQEGAVLIGKDNRIMAAEPNGIADNIKDDDFSWERAEKANFVERAIQNTLWQAGVTCGSVFSDATLYVTQFPSRRCMRAIVRAKVGKLVWFPLHEKLEMVADIPDKEKEAINKIAKLGGTTLEEFKGNLNWMRDQLDIFLSVGIFK